MPTRIHYHSGIEARRVTTPIGRAWMVWTRSGPQGIARQVAPDEWHSWIDYQAMKAGDNRCLYCGPSLMFVAIATGRLDPKTRTSDHADQSVAALERTVALKPTKDVSMPQNTSTEEIAKEALRNGKPAIQTMIARLSQEGDRERADVLDHALSILDDLADPGSNDFRDCHLKAA